jgi:hypothetical protein
VILEVLTDMTMKVTGFWDVTPHTTITFQRSLLYPLG